jgi:hypothetical protein
VGQPYPHEAVGAATGETRTRRRRTATGADGST